MTAPTHIDLPRRMGDRTEISRPMPNIQLAQLGSTELHEALKARLGRGPTAVALLRLPENRLMVHGPRDDAEFEVVHGLLLEAYRYAGGRFSKGMSEER